ncbi:hypothetical protein B484DRAFT_412484 [Ochromonadaceae sp. CCMP2298]|nr:hypothetical protein B484DRAFT_412484 [Ochromonadaceae sp. CCMP2298]
MSDVDDPTNLAHVQGQLNDQASYLRQFAERQQEQNTQMHDLILETQRAQAEAQRRFEMFMDAQPRSASSATPAGTRSPSAAAGGTYARPPREDLRRHPSRATAAADTIPPVTRMSAGIFGSAFGNLFSAGDPDSDSHVRHPPLALAQPDARRETIFDRQQRHSTESSRELTMLAMQPAYSHIKLNTGKGCEQERPVMRCRQQVSTPAK